MKEGEVMFKILPALLQGKVGRRERQSQGGPTEV